MLHVCSVKRRGDRQKMGVPSLQNRHQKRVVEWPSLNSPKQSEGDGWCWANLQNTVFYGLKRKRLDFERSVLVYVSSTIPALTLSGRKSRGCVNQPDRLTPNRKATICMVGIFAFWQGKTFFYAGSVRLWYSTGIKNRFDAASNKKRPMPRMFSGRSPSQGHSPSQRPKEQTKPRPPA